MSTTQQPAVQGDGAPVPVARHSEPPPTDHAVVVRRPRRRKRGRMVAIGAVVAVAAGAGIGYTVIQSDSADSKADNFANTSPTSLAAIAQGKLSSRIPVDGTLSFAGSYKIINKASGTYTRLPKVGNVIKSGSTLYMVDGKPVIFLKGATPVYRELTKGLKGKDVRQLNAALVDLGYADADDLDPDSNEFTWATKLGVKELQDDLGFDETGTFPTDLAVFLPRDALRVTEVSTVNGTKAATDGIVFSASSTDREVSVAMAAANQSQVKVGDKVSITLPNLKTTGGVVTAVGLVATKDTDGNLTVPVTIRPLNKKATGTLDKAPVQVSIVTETANSVLSVPVNALLALANGAYAVEVVGSDNVHTLVPVTLGIFDNEAGTVAIKGDGLTAGQKVVVPSS